MLPDSTNLEARIDRDRRDEEALLLLFLLGLMSRARTQAYAAARVGTDPVRAVADVLYGNPILGIPSPAQQLARYLAGAELAGFRRTLLVLPGDELRRPGVGWPDYAAQALSQMLATLQRRIAVGLSVAQRGVGGVLAALRDVFRTGGYTRENPYRLRTAAETLTGTAYNAGYTAGLNRPSIREVLTGFRYSAILDDVTTEICQTYHAVQLPADHTWWLTHFPMCHWNCRSVVLPIFGSFIATENPPVSPPPMAGFGRAPFALYSTFGRAA